MSESQVNSLALHQPSYWPYCGFFHKFFSAKHFLYLDTVQFVKNEFKNRNRILSKDGSPIWLTLPVSHKSSSWMNEVKVVDPEKTLKSHLDLITRCYENSPNWSVYEESLKDLYSYLIGIKTDDLCRINRIVTSWALYWLSGEYRFLNFEGKFIYDGIESTSSLQMSHGTKELPLNPTKRLISICRETGVSSYLAGIGSKKYMDFTLFEEARISVLVQEFSMDPYPQSSKEFIANLSVLDYLFNAHPRALLLDFLCQCSGSKIISL